MELNIVNNTQYVVEESILYDIALKTEDVLNLTKNYVVSVIFVDEEYIHMINKEYRNIDRSTDVISFALFDNENEYTNEEVAVELGDIFINVSAIVEQALRYSHSEKREMGFLFGHGLLHLLGYDHINENDEKEMFALQEKIIDEIIPRTT